MKLFIFKHKWLIILTIILTVLTSLAYVYIAVILQNVTDTALSGNYQTFYKVLILSVSYLILIGSINLIASLCTKMFIANCIKSLRINIFRKIIGYNTEKYMKVNTADYLSAFTNDITLIEQNYLLPLFSVLQNSITFLGAVIMLFIISPLIAGILIGFLLLTIIIPSLFGKVLQKRQDQLSKSLSAFTSKTKDLLSGFDVIRSFGIQKQILAQFEYKNNVVYQSRYQSDKVTAISESIAEILAYFTLFSGIFIGAFLVMKGQISVGTLLALIQLSSALVNPLMVGMQMLTMIQGTKPILDRLEGFMNYEETEFCGRAIPTFSKRIELKQVSFSYSKDKKVIDCVNFIFEKNKKYAIVGKSGCGKSTLVKLLTANYGSYEGEILYDNYELHELNIFELPQKSAMIHQNVYLFDDTVKDNICLYQTLPDIQLERALSVSGVNHFENELPEKRMTIVGEGGNRLSGGQRQRVAVARALIQEKPFLILDEGTSAIDMKTAYEIESSLLAEKELTLITITHNMRREILEQYDVIIFMEGGKIIQAGSFDDLAETCKTFKDFLHIKNQDTTN